MATTLAPHIYRALINFKLHGELEIDNYTLRATDMSGCKAIASSYNWDSNLDGLLQRVKKAQKSEDILILKAIDNANPKDPINAAFLVLTFGEDSNHDSTAEIQYWIAPTHHGRGLAIKFLKLISDHAFYNWGIASLSVKALKNALAYQYTLERAGFEKTGTLKGRANKYAQILHALYTKQNPRLYPQHAG